MSRNIESLAELGSRLAEARKGMGLTQADLGREVGMDRTAVTRIEAGQRGIDALELARIAQVLKRPIGWFLVSPPPQVVSRRAERGVVEGAADLELERLARDTELLVELGSLALVDPPRPGFRVETVEDAERAAAFVRERLRQPDLLDLPAATDALGMVVASIEFQQERFEGSYVALEQGGVALINGRMPSGRRRFTMAHELGHHILADGYSPEWVVGDNPDERERIVNAFAVHLLMPRDAVRAVWQTAAGGEDARRGALTVGARFGVSWSAVCNHLRNLGLIDEGQRRLLAAQAPQRTEYIELALRVVEEEPAPSLSPVFASAVLKAYRGRKVSRARALELLRGTVAERELPPLGDVPAEAMLAELAPLDS